LRPGDLTITYRRWITLTDTGRVLLARYNVKRDEQIAGGRCSRDRLLPADCGLGGVNASIFRPLAVSGRVLISDENYVQWTQQWAMLRSTHVVKVHG